MDQHQRIYEDGDLRTTTCLFVGSMLVFDGSTTEFLEFHRHFDGQKQRSVEGLESCRFNGPDL